jgi:hypothetical protein
VRVASIIIAAVVGVAVQAFAGNRDEEESCGQQAKALGISGNAREDFMKQCVSQLEAQRKHPAPSPRQSAQAPGQAPPATAATPQPKEPVLTIEQRRVKCAGKAKRGNVPRAQRKQFMDKCMAR